MIPRRSDDRVRKLRLGPDDEIAQALVGEPEMAERDKAHRPFPERLDVCGHCAQRVALAVDVGREGPMIARRQDQIEAGRVGRKVLQNELEQLVILDTPLAREVSFTMQSPP